MRVHWLLLSVLLGALALGLAGQAPGRLLGTDAYQALPAGAAGTVPGSIARGGPGIGDVNGRIESIPASDKSIALTFDDGPDPVWTARVREVLDRHGVRGTFFVLGSRVLADPGQTAALSAAGHEIGLHSFSHVSLAEVPAWRADMELRFSQLLVQGATGRSTALFRPPFAAGTDALDDHAWRFVQRAVGTGYVVVMSTLDSKDWTGRGVPEIVRATTVTGPHGQVLLFHDGGGDRAETVAALDQLIPQLQAKGYRFVTVSEALRLTAATAPAPPPTHLLGALVLWSLAGCVALVNLVGATMLIAGVITVARALLLLAAARRHSRATGPQAGVTDPVSVIVPAYNEAAGIQATVHSLVASTHPVEVVVVDDGSSDGTADLAEAMGLPGVKVIRQANGGKPAALNTGIATAAHDVLVMIDGATVLEPGTVAELVQPFADPRVGAVSGNAKVANRSGVLGRWQHIEYVLGFNMDRRWYDLAGCMPTVPGAVGAFRRAALDDVGGLSHDALAEDTDLTMAIGRAGWRVTYQPGARAWTEAPATLRALWRQRYRWSYGTMQAMWKHRSGLFQAGAGGRYTRRALSYMTLFQVLLPLLAPAVDLFALYGLLFLDPWRTLAVWAAFQAIDLLVACYAFHLDHESPRPLWALPFTQLFYRQLMYAVVIQALATAVTGVRLPWQRMDRYGTFSVQRVG